MTSHGIQFFCEEALAAEAAYYEHAEMVRKIAEHEEKLARLPEPSGEFVVRNSGRVEFVPNVPEYYGFEVDANGNDISSDEEGMDVTLQEGILLLLDELESEGRSGGTFPNPHDTIRVSYFIDAFWREEEFGEWTESFKDWILAGYLSRSVAEESMVELTPEEEVEWDDIVDVEEEKAQITITVERFETVKNFRPSGYINLGYGSSISYLTWKKRMGTHSAGAVLMKDMVRKVGNKTRKVLKNKVERQPFKMTYEWLESDEAKQLRKERKMHMEQISSTRRNRRAEAKELVVEWINHKRDNFNFRQLRILKEYAPLVYAELVVPMPRPSYSGGSTIRMVRFRQWELSDHKTYEQAAFGDYIYTWKKSQKSLNQLMHALNGNINGWMFPIVNGFQNGFQQPPTHIPEPSPPQVTTSEQVTLTQLQDLIRANRRDHIVFQRSIDDIVKVLSSDMNDEHIAHNRSTPINPAQPMMGIQRQILRLAGEIRSDRVAATSHFNRIDTKLNDICAVMVDGFKQSELVVKKVIEQTNVNTTKISNTKGFVRNIVSEIEKRLNDFAGELASEFGPINSTVSALKDRTDILKKGLDSSVTALNVYRQSVDNKILDLHNNDRKLGSKVSELIVNHNSSLRNVGSIHQNVVYVTERIQQSVSKPQMNSTPQNVNVHFNTREQKIAGLHSLPASIVNPLQLVPNITALEQLLPRGESAATGENGTRWISRPDKLPSDRVLLNINNKNRACTLYAANAQLPEHLQVDVEAMGEPPVGGWSPLDIPAIRDGKVSYDIWKDGAWMLGTQDPAVAFCHVPNGDKWHMDALLKMDEDGRPQIFPQGENALMRVEYSLLERGETGDGGPVENLSFVDISKGMVIPATGTSEGYIVPKPEEQWLSIAKNAVLKLESISPDVARIFGSFINDGADNDNVSVTHDQTAQTFVHNTRLHVNQGSMTSATLLSYANDSKRSRNITLEQNLTVNRSPTDLGTLKDTFAKMLPGGVGGKQMDDTALQFAEIFTNLMDVSEQQWQYVMMFLWLGYMEAATGGAYMSDNNSAVLGNDHYTDDGAFTGANTAHFTTAGSTARPFQSPHMATASGRLATYHGGHFVLPAGAAAGTPNRIRGYAGIWPQNTEEWFALVMAPVVRTGGKFPFVLLPANKMVVDEEPRIEPGVRSFWTVLNNFHQQNLGFRVRNTLYAEQTEYGRRTANTNYSTFTTGIPERPKMIFVSRFIRPQSLDNNTEFTTAEFNNPLSWLDAIAYLTHNYDFGRFCAEGLRLAIETSFKFTPALHSELPSSFCDRHVEGQGMMLKFLRRIFIMRATAIPEGLIILPDAAPGRQQHEYTGVAADDVSRAIWRTHQRLKDGYSGVNLRDTAANIEAGHRPGTVGELLDLLEIPDFDIDNADLPAIIDGNRALYATNLFEADADWYQSSLQRAFFKWQVELPEAAGEDSYDDDGAIERLVVDWDELEDFLAGMTTQQHNQLILWLHDEVNNDLDQDDSHDFRSRWPAMPRGVGVSKDRLSLTWRAHHYHADPIPIGTIGNVAPIARPKDMIKSIEHGLYRNRASELPLLNHYHQMSFPHPTGLSLVHQAAGMGQFYPNDVTSFHISTIISFITGYGRPAAQLDVEDVRQVAMRKSRPLQAIINLAVAMRVAVDSVTESIGLTPAMLLNSRGQFESGCSELNRLRLSLSLARPQFLSANYDQSAYFKQIAGAQANMGIANPIETYLSTGMSMWVIDDNYWFTDDGFTGIRGFDRSHETIARRLCPLLALHPVLKTLYLTNDTSSGPAIVPRGLTKVGGDFMLAKLNNTDVPWANWRVNETEQFREDVLGVIRHNAFATGTLLHIQMLQTVRSIMGSGERHRFQYFRHFNRRGPRLSDTYPFMACTAIDPIWLLEVPQGIHYEFGSPIETFERERDSAPRIQSFTQKENWLMFASPSFYNGPGMSIVVNEQHRYFNVEVGRSPNFTTSWYHNVGAFPREQHQRGTTRWLTVGGNDDLSYTDPELIRALMPSMKTGLSLQGSTYQRKDTGTPLKQWRRVIGGAGRGRIDLVNQQGLDRLFDSVNTTAAWPTHRNSGYTRHYSFFGALPAREGQLFNEIVTLQPAMRAWNIFAEIIKIHSETYRNEYKVNQPILVIGKLEIIAKSLGYQDDKNPSAEAARGKRQKVMRRRHKLKDDAPPQIPGQFAVDSTLPDLRRKLELNQSERLGSSFYSLLSGASAQDDQRLKEEELKKIREEHETIEKTLKDEIEQLREQVAAEKKKSEETDLAAQSSIEALRAEMAEYKSSLPTQLVGMMAETIATAISKAFAERDSAYGGSDWDGKRVST